MNLTYSIIVSLVWFLSTYFNVVFMLILLTNKKDIFKTIKYAKTKEYPKVSLIVPAFNEQATIADSIKSLKQIDYPKDKLEIIIVNDGSCDNTSKIVKKHLGKHFIFLDNKENKGKAACLNQGISIATGEYIGCMDADSECSKDIIKKLVPYFQDEKIGAVTVSVEVKNAKTLLQKITEIEYIIGLSLALKALSYFNAIHVTPGPFSMYRKSLLDKIGCFDVKNITEDLEIAYRIQKSGYKIAACTATKVRTVTPGTFKTLYRQRKRWYPGSVGTMIQHRKLLFNSKLGYFSYIVPYTFMLVLFGLFLFGFSMYLAISNFVKSMMFFSLTNFNFWSYMTFNNFDVLTLSTLTFFGIAAMATTIISAYVCMKIANKSIRKRKVGFFAFFFIFYLYQVFWASSLFAVIFGKKVKWR